MSRTRKRRPYTSPGYRPGALAWLTRDLVVPGSTIFPVPAKTPTASASVPPEVELDAGAALPWSEKEGWCE